VNQASFSAIKSLITAAADFEDLTTVPVAWDVTVAPDRLKVSFSTTVEEEVEEPTEVTELAILFPLRKIFKNPTSGNLVLVSHQLFVCLLLRWM